MTDHIENKVAKSGLVTLDLEEIKPKWTLRSIDFADVLWQGLVLREKEFRDFIGSHNWDQYAGAAVYITCTTEAIIPTWAYMLLANALNGKASTTIVGTKEQLELVLWREFIEQLDLGQYLDQRVVLKGCGDERIPETVYLHLTSRLVPVVKSLMFGEPCSTVPVFKKK